jgi:hypothetical protein
MGEKYGTMSPDKLEKAIQDSRNNRSIQYSNSSEHQFLRSIHSTCGKLPHSNEACLDARRIYFSFLMKFGIPAIFLTITPDDLRSFRVVVYSLSPNKVSAYGEIDPKTFSESDILTDFNIRREARVQHPGLCAEEYQRLMGSTGMVFGYGRTGQKVIAWALPGVHQGLEPSDEHPAEKKK